MRTGEYEQLGTGSLNAQVKRATKGKLLGCDVHHLHWVACCHRQRAIRRARIDEDDLNIFDCLLGDAFEQAAKVFFFVIGADDD